MSIYTVSANQASSVVENGSRSLWLPVATAVTSAVAVTAATYFTGVNSYWTCAAVGATLLLNKIPKVMPVTSAATFFMSLMGALQALPGNPYCEMVSAKVCQFVIIFPHCTSLSPREFCWNEAEFSRNALIALSCAGITLDCILHAGREARKTEDAKSGDTKSA